MVEYKDNDLGRTHRYHYDCFGRRVAKVVDAHDVLTQKITRYSYGGAHSGASWQILEEYPLWFPALPATPPDARYVYGNYIDEPIQMQRDVDGGPGGAGAGPLGMQTFYYHVDDLFSVVALSAGQANTRILNDATVYGLGAVVERYRFGDYGSSSATNAAGSQRYAASRARNPFRFTAREYDEETKLSYYRTRYLDHAWGRFTTRDTIGTWGDGGNTGNALGFVGNAPFQSVDPFGEMGPDDGESLDDYLDRTLKGPGTKIRDAYKDDWKRNIDQLRKEAQEFPDDVRKILHDTLDVLGTVPGAGEAADGINGLLHYLNGEDDDALLSFACMLPAGDLAKLKKWADKLRQLVNKNRILLPDGRAIDLAGKGHRNKAGGTSEIVPTPHVHDPSQKHIPDKKGKRDVRPATEKDLKDAEEHIKKTNENT